MNRLLDWLHHGPLITDGAWGTQLQGLGLEPGENPDPWNLMHPERVEQVARAYVEAGSRIILTNTFRANAISLAEHGAAEIEEINRAGVAISRRAVEGTKTKVIASMGPSGKMLMTGEVTPEQITGAFAQQARACAEAGADALLLETFSDLEEASLALAAARAARLPVIVSFVFDSGKNKDRTMMGTTPEQVATRMQAEGAAAVGANCGLGPDGFPPISTRLRDACELPIWIKPNAGLPEIVDGEARYTLPPAEFAGYLAALLDAGACFIGGCCGTNPSFIRALAVEMRRCATS
jgi:5-methyltetrahydrofolate--homocysteine methyltransferase